MARLQGVVKFFNAQKGFGFITPDAGGKEMFVHVNGLDAGTHTLHDGQRVEYDVEEGRKGPEARNVTALQ